MTTHCHPVWMRFVQYPHLPVNSHFTMSIFEDPTQTTSWETERKTYNIQTTQLSDDSSPPFETTRCSSRVWTTKVVRWVHHMTTTLSPAPDIGSKETAGTRFWSTQKRQWFRDGRSLATVAHSLLANIHVEPMVVRLDLGQVQRDVQRETIMRKTVSPASKAGRNWSDASSLHPGFERHILEEWFGRSTRCRSSHSLFYRVTRWTHRRWKQTMDHRIHVEPHPDQSWESIICPAC